MKKAFCVVSYKQIEPKLFEPKHCQKTVETTHPSLNVLPVFIITEQTVLVQFVYVKGLFTPCAHFRQKLWSVIHLKELLNQFRRVSFFCVCD